MGAGYIKTPAGIMKIAEEVCNFIGFVCVVATGTSPTGDAFLAASIMAFIITGILLIVHMFDFQDKLPHINKIECVYCAIFAIFYLVTSALVIKELFDGYIAGGVFGLFATIIYAIDAFDKFKQG